MKHNYPYTPHGSSPSGGVEGAVPSSGGVGEAVGASGAVRLPSYRASIKTIMAHGNKRIDPDGFGSFSIINGGETLLLVNGVIPLKPGARFEVPFEPYVQFASEITLSFEPDPAGQKASLAYAVLVYYKPLDQE